MMLSVEGTIALESPDSLCDWKGVIMSMPVYPMFLHSPQKLVTWVTVKRLWVAVKTLAAACYAFPQFKILGLIDGIVICLMITWFATNFFEVKNVKEIEPASKKSIIIFTAAMEAGITIISIMALLSSFTTFKFGMQKAITSWQLLLHTVGLVGGRAGGVHCSLFMFLLIEEGQDALGLELNKFPPSLSLEDNNLKEGSIVTDKNIIVDFSMVGLGP